ncbi:hypothetical protein GCM10017752_48490 [Streptomyces roseoviridis]
MVQARHTPALLLARSACTLLARLERVGAAGLQLPVDADEMAIGGEPSRRPWATGR